MKQQGKDDPVRKRRQDSRHTQQSATKTNADNRGCVDTTTQVINDTTNTRKRNKYPFHYWKTRRQGMGRVTLNHNGTWTGSNHPTQRTLTNARGNENESPQIRKRKQRLGGDYQRKRNTDSHHGGRSTYQGDDAIVVTLAYIQSLGTPTEKNQRAAQQQLTDDTILTNLREQEGGTNARGHRMEQRKRKLSRTGQQR